MNVHLCRIALRPRGPLEVFDLTFAFVRAHPAVCVRLGAITVGPLAVLAVVLVWAMDGHLATSALPVVAAPLIGLPFTLLGGRLLFADTWTVRQVVRELLQRTAAVVTVLIGFLLLELVGWLTCGFGLMITRPLGAFLTESALLERTPLHGLYSRAFRLALQHPAGSVSVVGAWFVLTTWGFVAGEAFGQALVDSMLQFGKPFGTLLTFDEPRMTPYALVGALVVQPFFALYRVLQFVDVRTRVDGWDLQVGLRAASMRTQS